MTKMICTVCRRYYISEAIMANGSETGHFICARCNYLSYFKDLGHDADFIAEIKREIADEIHNIKIEGEDKSNFNPEDNKKFNELVLQVKAERGEAGIDKR